MIALALAGGIAALFAPPVAADPREGGIADVREVAFGQVDTALSLRVRFWDAREPACVATGERRICLDGKVVRVNGRRIAATVTDGAAIFSPADAGLERGAHDWWLETATDRVPDAGTFTTRVKVLGQPRCFGAAGRGCRNPRLRGVLTPTPADAPLIANAACRLLPRHGVLTPCEFGVTRNRTATFALIGDSHAATWRAALEVVAQAKRWRGISITRPGCPFSAQIPASPDLGPAECRRLQRQTLAYLRARPSIHTIFVSSWAQPPSGPHGGTGGYGGDAAAYAALLDQRPAQRPPHLRPARQSRHTRRLRQYGRRRAPLRASPIARAHPRPACRRPPPARPRDRPHQPLLRRQPLLPRARRRVRVQGRQPHEPRLLHHARPITSCASSMADPFREPVTLSDPDPAWAAAYARLAAELAPAIDGTLEHIGSTAVPLRAKPIIDIQVATADRARAIAALERLGFTHHGEGGIPGRAYLTRRTAPAVNVHVFDTDNPLLDTNRAIRDHLRAHPEAARAYAAAKDAALAAGHDDLLAYSDAKAATVAAIKADALRI